MNTADLERRRLNITSVAAALGAALLGLAGPAAAASLVAAARDGDVAAVRAQLKAGTDANEVESDGSSALLWAAYQSSPELIALLLRSGADPNLPNEFGVTPLLQA